MNQKKFNITVLILLIICAVLGAIFIFVKPESSKNFPIIKFGEPVKTFSPQLSENVQDLVLTTDSFISVFVGKDNKQKILIQQNKDKPLRIASITKLTSALVIKDNVKDGDVITINKSNISEAEGNSGNFQENENFFAMDLMRAMLIPSDNIAAKAFAESIGTEKFVLLMNEEAKKVGMKNSAFFNPSGLDYLPYDSGFNYSTPEDIAIEMLYIKNKYPDIFALTTLKNTEVCNYRGLACRTLISTDQLLNTADFPFKILGAKTGSTPLAGKNLAMIIEAPEGQGIIVNVVLNSLDHFADMKKLTNWVADSYSWK